MVGSALFLSAKARHVSMSSSNHSALHMFSSKLKYALFKPHMKAGLPARLCICQCYIRLLAFDILTT